ncbi:MAG: hypothetical protein UY50_C0018G0016 [Parcubacteria group bacterium GW2011_GWA2_49_9]|nr:MAG: hypothetical protein UY50_C0018G0016 [Parcubacteria group bacterium GW2011_GWA2_49_9]
MGTIQHAACWMVPITSPVSEVIYNVHLESRDMLAAVMGAKKSSGRKLWLDNLQDAGSDGRGDSASREKKGFISALDLLQAERERTEPKAEKPKHQRPL